MSALSPEEKQRIYEEEKARLEAQTQLKADEATKAGKKAATGCVGCLGLIVMLAVVVYLMLPDTSSVPPRPNRGEQGQLVNGDASMRVAVDSPAFDAASRSISAKDQIGLQSLFSQGRVFMVKANTKVLVLDPGILSTTVRLLDGPHSGKSVVVYTEWVAR